MENDFYLSLGLQKSLKGKTDEYGNPYFEVEASNENLDLQEQVVLQTALLASKDHFLSNGVISNDHLHKRIENEKIISEPENVIGEPVSVKTDGKKTIVEYKLYKNNPIARQFINLLESGSSRVRASVGGVFPKVVKDLKTGVEKVVSVLWNDMALTVSPVNATVSPSFAKSYIDSKTFVKALSTGYGTDSAQFIGGRALIKEDALKKTDHITEVEDNELEDIIRSLLAALSTGEIIGKQEALQFLGKRGISEQDALEIMNEINAGGI